MAVAGVPLVNREPFTEEFEEIFQAHHDMVYRTAYGVTGSVEDAEDIAQTIFLRVLRREIALGSLKNPAGYMYRAAVNLSLTVVRSRSHSITNADAVFSVASNQAQAAIQAEDEHRRLYEAIAKLPTRMAELVVLRYQHELSDAEIAKILGTSRGVIAVTLYRARARLKKLLRALPGIET